MQDSTLYSQIKPQFPEQEHLKCPRCDSSNTKFCYYNNYNLSQPRHFCKNCRRYWTKGGALRNIPVGGGCRKNTKRSSSSTKRSSSSSSSISSTTTSASPSSAAASAASSCPSTTQIIPKPEPFRLAAAVPFDQDSRLLDVNGSFSSLLASNVRQFGTLLEGLNPNGSNQPLCGFIDHGPSPSQDSVQNPGQNGTPNDDSALQMGLQNGSSPDGFLSVQSGQEDSTCWNGSHGWPDLAIYTPGPSFQ